MTLLRPDTGVEFALRIPAERVELVDDDERGFITPRRARALRVEIDSERAAARYFGEIPSPDGGGESDVAPKMRPPAASSPPPAVPPGVIMCGGTPTESDLQAVAEFAAELRRRAPASPPGVRPCVICKGEPTRLYMTGWRCARHTPAADAGHLEPPTPDPTMTAVALRERHERRLRAQKRANLR